MAWVYLVLAGLLEIGWAVGLKYTDGFSRFWPSAITVLLMMFSFAFLSLSLRSLPIGTAYAVWTGIGAAGTALVGMWLFGDPRGIARILCLFLIIAGVAGLKLTSPST